MGQFPARHLLELPTRVERRLRRADALISRGEFPGREHDESPDLTLLTAPNSGEIGVHMVEEVVGAVIEAILDTDIPAAIQLLSRRNFMNNGATAAAVAYNCSGVYVEPDYCRN